MSEFKRKILAFLFAVLCLLSSMQVVLNYHFCSENLVCTSINEVQESCCMPVEHQVDHLESNCSEAPCCDDFKFVKNTQEFKSNEISEIPDFSALSQTSVIDISQIVGENFDKNTYIIDTAENFMNYQQQFCVYRI